MSLCPLQTNATPTKPLYAPIGAGGGGSDTLYASTINASTITLNANQTGETANPTPPCINFNLGAQSTATLYPVYTDTVPFDYTAAALIINNHGGAIPPLYDRYQSLGVGTLSLHDITKAASGQTGTLLKADGNGNLITSSIFVSSINGAAPGGAVSTFSTLTTKGLLVPAGANPDSGFFTTNTTAVREYDGGNLTTLTLSLTGLVAAPTFTNLALGKLLVGGNTEASGSSNCAIIGAEPSTSLGVGGLSLNANGVYMGQTIISSISGLGGGGNPYQTKFIDYTNGSTITMAQLVSSVIG